MKEENISHLGSIIKRGKETIKPKMGLIARVFIAMSLLFMVTHYFDDGLLNIQNGYYNFLAIQEIVLGPLNMLVAIYLLFGRRKVKAVALIVIVLNLFYWLYGVEGVIEGELPQIMDPHNIDRLTARGELISALRWYAQYVCLSLISFVLAFFLPSKRKSDASISSSDNFKTS